jgi:hypothetical protein
VEGDWTTAFAKALGCNFPQKDEKGKAKDVTGNKDGVTLEVPLNRYLPRVMIDGPFGSASEDFNKFETVLLVGGELRLRSCRKLGRVIDYLVTQLGSESLLSLRSSNRSGTA